MKNLTEGEKMVWAAVYAMETGRGKNIRMASCRAYYQIIKLRSIKEEDMDSEAFETAKEVLK